MRSPSHKEEHYPLTFSSVFREMLSINHTSSATTDTIELTDCAIENSHTIRLMLDMMYATPIERPPDSYLPYLVPAVELMKKYDCDTGLELLRRNLRIWAADIRIPAKIDIFSAAAHLNDIDTCCLAIYRGGNLKRGTSGKVNAYGANLNLDLGMTNANNFDLAGMSQGELERMPKKYILALLRATKGVDLASLGSQPEWFNIAESFRSFVGTGTSRRRPPPYCQH